MQNINRRFLVEIENWFLQTYFSKINLGSVFNGSSYQVEYFDSSNKSKWKLTNQEFNDFKDIFKVLTSNDLSNINRLEYYYLIENKVKDNILTLKIKTFIDNGRKEKDYILTTYKLFFN